MITVTRRKTVAPPRRLLYGPGPSTVDQCAYEAMGQPVIGLRDPYFLQIADELRAGLRTAFGTTNQVTLPIPASGTGAMEACVANFVSPGDKFGVFAAGHFADRIALIAERHGAIVVKCEKAWGQVFTSADAEEFIDRERPDVVAFVQAETSTGAYQSGRAIVPAAHQAGALVIADTVTSLGAMPVELDSVGIDVTFSCSQKGLSCPAGLSPVSVSAAAFERLKDSSREPRSWYFDLKLMARYFEPPHVYHHTPSPPLYYAMHQVLASIEEEGLHQRWQRHRDAGEQLLSGLVAFGFQPLVQEPAHRISHLTTVFPPASLDEAGFRARLLERHDIEIATGLGQLSGKVLRIGTMGPLATKENVSFLLSAIEDCL